MLTKNLTTAFLFVIISFSVLSQSRLPRSTPESEGVSSEGVLNFLNAAAASKNEFHSIMILRHGKVIAEGWWNPYHAELVHTMYSVSKSFTATAIGFAVSEKKLTVNDKVIDFFPEKLPDTVSEYLKLLTIKDLLTMSVGQDPDPTGSVGAREYDWVKAFLALKITNKPGTKFLYNSLGTYMLSAIVQKVTGQTVLDYLTPRLFGPLGIKGIDWETDPKGINTGGWGLRLKTEDMAKFGLLFLQKGKWNGQQLLPESWIEEASTKHIDQRPELSQADKDKSDWLQGYGYQMWRCRNNAYRGDGAFGQYIIVMPEKDAVIAITSETGNMQDELNLVWEHLLPAMKNDKLSTNEKYNLLKKRLSQLSLVAPASKSDTIPAVQINKRNYKLESNVKRLSGFSLSFAKRECNLELKTDSSTYYLNYGNGKWKQGITNKKGPSLTGSLKNHYAGIRSPRFASAYTWKDAKTLELTIRYIESPHTERMNFVFEGNAVTLTVENSFEPQNRVIIKGTVQ